MTDLTSLATRIADRFDVDQAAAFDLAETYLEQVADVDDTTIDRDDIHPGDADFIISAIAESRHEVTAQPVDDLAEAVLAHDSAEQDLIHARSMRDQAIRAALAVGTPWSEVIAATGLSRGQIATIRRAGQ